MVIVGIAGQCHAQGLENTIMAVRILIAYASKYGSTGEIAGCIGEVLQGAGIEVDVRTVEAVADVSSYDGVLVGSATRMDKLLPDALKFARKHESELRGMRTAYFVVGVTMKQDTPENREKVRGFLEPLCRIREPIGLGLFAGKLDYSKLRFYWRALASRDKSGLMAEGDFRDWNAIRAWAHEMASAFSA
jgi:menaquinone-dependent protoporphyrinogen oxidase